MPRDDREGRQRGILAEWNDDRGFGIIEPDTGGPRAFAHVSAFPRGARPVAGSRVTYVESRDERDRARASDVRYRGGMSAGRRSSSATSSALAIGALFFAVLAGLVVLDELPLVLLAAYGLVSGVAVLVYRADKKAATRGTWRTSESTLHAIALLGGWPGALVGRRAFRHKTTKQPFRTIFWLTVVANSAALAWFVHAGPRTLW